MTLEQVAIVHVIDMITSQDQDILWRNAIEYAEIAVDRIGGTSVP
jgi:hypothetical protein